MLSVMTTQVSFAFVRLPLRSNDREKLTITPMYLQEGEYFTERDFVAADGGFEGDGRFKCSHKNSGKDPGKTFNVTWQEVCTRVENKELLHGVLYWVTIKENSCTQTRCCCWPFMLQSGFITIF
jgi:hypothetical protein